MLIICIVGLIGCGKDTASDYIEHKYGYVTINTGNIIRDFARKEGLDVTRENLHYIRRKYGNSFVGDEVVRLIKEKGLKRVLLNGIRRSEDYEIPKKVFGGAMKMILIETDKEKRFERLHKRGLDRDPNDMEHFERHESVEFELYDFDRTFSYADYRIDNNSTIEDLHKKLDEVMKDIEKQGK